MIEMQLKIYTQKEATEVIKKLQVENPGKIYRKKKVLLNLEVDPRCEGTHKGKYGFIIIEEVWYHTAVYFEDWKEYHKCTYLNGYKIVNI